MNLRRTGSHRSVLEFPSGLRVLFSYQTPVAAHVPGAGFARVDAEYSKTTERHIAEFVGDDTPRRLSQAAIALTMNADAGTHSAGMH